MHFASTTIQLLRCFRMGKQNLCCRPSDLKVTNTYWLIFCHKTAFAFHSCQWFHALAAPLFSLKGLNRCVCASHYQESPCLLLPQTHQARIRQKHGSGTLANKAHATAHAPKQNPLSQSLRCKVKWLFITTFRISQSNFEQLPNHIPCKPLSEPAWFKSSMIWSTASLCSSLEKKSRKHSTFFQHLLSLREKG